MQKCGMCKHSKPDDYFVKPNGSLYKICADCRAYSREYSRWYSATYPEQRRASRRAFKKTEKGRETERRYRRSAKGRDLTKRVHEKYRASEKGKMKEREYRQISNECRRKRDSQKYRARNKVNNALRDGRIEKPLHCEMCGNEEVLHAHHHSGWSDEFALNVWWVCSRCDPPFGSVLPHDGGLALESAQAWVA